MDLTDCDLVLDCLNERLFDLIICAVGKLNVVVCVLVRHGQSSEFVSRRQDSQPRLRPKLKFSLLDSKKNMLLSAVSSVPT